MKTIRQVLGVILLLAAGTQMTYAGNVKINSVWPGSTTDLQVLYVIFVTPVSIDASEVVFKCKGPARPNPWHVVLYDKQGKPVVLDGDITQACTDSALFTTRGRVDLHFSHVLSEYSRIDVTFGAANAPFATLSHPSTKPVPIVEPAKTKNDATVYISGTVTPSVGAGPSYSIDSSLKYVFFEHGPHSLFASGQVKTDNRPTADPDSFNWSVGYKLTGTSRHSLEWDFAGMQMDKKANAMNFVSAPRYTLNVQKLFKMTKCSDGQTTKCPAGHEYQAPSVLIGTDFNFGVELGDNFRNDFSIANNTGLGTFFRGTPGAEAYVVFPDALHFKKVIITSTYAARIPTTNELFLETRQHTGKPIPELTSNTRHYLQNDIQFMFADYAGFEIKHQYGSLPPTFTFVDNRTAVGLVLQLKQDRNPY